MTNEIMFGTIILLVLPLFSITCIVLLNGGDIMKKGTLKTFNGVAPKDKTAGSSYSYIIEYTDGEVIEVDMSDVNYGYDMVFDKLLDKYGDDERTIVRIEIKLGR